MSEPKRRRIEAGSGSPLRRTSRTSELSTERLQRELDALLSGDAGHRTLAWSAQNLIAFATPVLKPESITLQYMTCPTYQHGAASSSGRASQPKQRTPSHKLFPSVALLPAHSAVTSPTLISFSPSGRTLVAYFPASAFAKRMTAAATASASALGPSAGKGRLCIWTQSSSRALNDWNLRQIVFVEDEEEEEERVGLLEEGEGGTEGQQGPGQQRQAPPGFVFVDGVDEPVPVPIPAAPIGGPDAMVEGAAPGSVPVPVLRGGIRELRWCDEGRKLFIHPDIGASVAKKDHDDQSGDAPSRPPDPDLSYMRDAPRGPTFARPDTNSTFSFRPNVAGGSLAHDEVEEACFLFGKTGTISVLHRKPNLPTRTVPSSLTSTQPFSLTSTSLFEAGVVPLGVQHSRPEDGEQGARTQSLAGTRALRKISHLAVGGVPDEPLFLVAYRLSPRAQGRVPGQAGGDGTRNRTNVQGVSPNAAADAAAAAGLIAQATAGIRDSPTNQDPLGLMSAATGSSLGAPNFGLGLGFDLELGYGGEWHSGDGDCEVVHAVLEGMIGLCEVRLRTHGNMPALVVRPLDPVPLPTFQSAGHANEGAIDAGSPDQTCGNVTHLQWLEYPHKTHTAVEGPSPLQLMVVCSHDRSGFKPSGDDTLPTEAMDVDVDLDARQGAAGDSYSSVHKYLIQRQLDPLTEAFGSLECKKADLPPAKADWAFFEAGRSTFEHQTILSLMPPQTVLQDGCLVALAVPTTGAPATLSQRWAWLDATSLSLVDLPDASCNAIPSPKDLRTAWAASPNKVWIARTIGSSAQHKVQIASLPLGPRLADLNSPTRVGVLLGRALKSGNNCEDVAALLSPLNGDLGLQTALDHAMVRAGICARSVASGSSEERTYKLGQIAKLVELNMLSRGPNLETQRLLLELLLCLRLIGLNDLGKRTPYLPFRFDAVWPLLSQLSWVLQSLNKLCRTAVYLEAEMLAGGSEIRCDDNGKQHSKLRPKFAERNPLLQLLVLPAPRALFEHIVQSMYRFAFWLVGDEVGPIPPSLVEAKDAAAAKAGGKYKVLGIRNITYTVAVSHAVIAWRKRQVTDGDLMPSAEAAFHGPAFRSTIVQQFEYASDACRAILEASAVRLDKALPALEALRNIPSGTADNIRWWNELATSALSERDEYRKLAASWLDEDHGVDADLVPLFINPADFLDDIHALDRINASAAAAAHLRPMGSRAKSGQQHTIVDTAGIGAIERDETDIGTLTLDVIRKTSLRLPTLGFDQSAAATAALFTGFGGPHQPPPPAVPTVVKSCVRCGARTGMFELPPVLSKGLAPLEDAFRERCLCGGGWWLLRT
ncbi:unnamed protein product [Tilletia laevis]|uniref:Mediator complex subunit 16 n=3 Tax=Tilletia TaxID=13289 RepID=A0A8X7MNI4_9BASI|nr:hypothetical protein CF336_g6468 [Tilletia laevis]KAE8189202.1 hypothetical protein CF328_g6355 [Tilletia controversa]KAE8252622.1 hypothetical protein A4X03_0g6117 [Tilletia caries]KAE8191316.1 hypothetical protein CF335_g6119 [Tilletia laevis]KAE8242088.1 hypothetical protein A4X06_0g7251 [Tilletia controversa]